MRVLKILGIVLGSIVGLIVLSLVIVTMMASGKLKKKFDIPPIEALAIPTDSVSIERGRRLATAVANCVECHGEDLGGKAFMDAGPIGFAAGTNLTRGAGGVGATFTDADFIRAIRYGIRADSTSLLIMPSESFAHFSDRDLASLIAYVKQVAPVDRTVPKTELKMLGKILMATGALPVLVAEHTPRPDRHDIQPAITAQYGSYLADLSGCRGCHGPDLAGGPAFGPPGTPPPPNITPAGNIAKWSEEDFFRALRDGKRPDGTMISEFMPWKSLGRMSDDELRAILMFLRTVEPVVPVKS